MNAEGEQVSLFDHAGCAGKMCLAHSAQEPQKAKTSGSSWRKSSELKAIPYMSLDLTPGRGNLLGESYWEMSSPWLGGSSMLNTGPAPLSEEDVFSLSQILEEKPPRKYYLSRTACLGILRRAKERGKELPPQLKAALLAQAGLTGYQASEKFPFGRDCLNPWDTQQARVFTPESKAPTLTGADSGGGRNPAGLLFAAGFCAGAGPSAGSIGYQEEISPTLKSSSSGNMMPAVLCLNDQGGSIMGCSEDVTGTLRAQEHGHQPLVFENHGIDSRYTGPYPVSPTLSARAGTGGNNLPLALQAREPICISGNIIDRQPQNGGNGFGCQEGIAYTLTATDHHAVYSRQRVDVFKDSNIASTESARQHKDATDLVCQEAEWPLLIRRLTPMECERLQGFPDHWTDIPSASDSARYRALGNSVAIPCVEYIMRGLAIAAGA